MASFAESFNRYQALAFPTKPVTGGRDATAATAALNATARTTESRLALLRELMLAVERAEQAQDTTALRLLQSQMDAYTASETARTRLVNTALANRGALDVAALRAAQADIANVRDNVARLMAADRTKGSSWAQSLIRQLSADPEVASNPTAFNNLLNSYAGTLDPNDPATYHAYVELRRRGGDATVPPQLFNAAKAAYDNREKEVQNLAGIQTTLSRGGVTGAQLQSYLATAGLDTPGPRPTYAGAMAEVTAQGGGDAKNRLQASIDQLQTELGVGDAGVAGAKPDRLGGLTEAEARKILNSEAFRSYAADRGFQLSSPESNVITVADVNALRAAAREQSTGRGPLFRGATRPREQTALPVQTEGKRPNNVPLVYATKTSEDGQYITRAYFEYPDGRVDEMNLTTGDATPILSAGGFPVPGASRQLVQGYMDAKPDGGMVLLAPDGQGLLTESDIVGPMTGGATSSIRSSLGLDLTAINPTTEDAPEVKSALRSFGTDTGRRMPTRIGEDPNLVKRVLAPDGTTIIRYTRETPDGFWQESGREEYGYRGVHAPMQRADEFGTPMLAPPDGKPERQTIAQRMADRRALRGGASGTPTPPIESGGYPPRLSALLSTGETEDNNADNLPPSPPDSIVVIESGDSMGNAPIGVWTYTRRIDPK